MGEYRSTIQWARPSDSRARSGLRTSASAPAGRMSLEDFEKTFGGNSQEIHTVRIKRREKSTSSLKMFGDSNSSKNTFLQTARMTQRTSMREHGKTLDELPTIRRKNPTSPSGSGANSIREQKANRTLWRKETVPNSPFYARPEKLTVTSADEVSVCIRCGQEVLRRQKRRHDDVLCPRRLIKCNNPGCNKMIPASSSREHERKSCKFAVFQEKLLKEVAGSDGVLLCPLGCGSAVPRRDLARHQRLDCPKYIVKCPHGTSCSTVVTRESLEKHVEICPVGKKNAAMALASKNRREVPIKCSPHHKFGCGKMLLQKDLLAHETNNCPNRLVQCRNLGCKEMVRLNLRSFHEDRMCQVKKDREELLSWGQEILDCPFGCGAELTVREVPNHKKEECPNRIVKCRINGCREKMYAVYREAHETLWEIQHDPNSGTPFYVNTVTQESSWERQGCPLLRKRQKYLKLLKEHAKLVKCPLGCGAEYVNNLNELRRHQEVCPRFPVPCPMAGCRFKIMRGEVQFHLEDECEVYLKRNLQSERAIAKRGNQKCPQCGILMPKQDLKNHMKSWCAEKMFRCNKPGCKMMISYGQMTKHALYDCNYWKLWDSRITAARRKQENPLPWVVEKLSKS